MRARTSSISLPYRSGSLAPKMFARYAITNRDDTGEALRRAEQWEQEQRMVTKPLQSEDDCPTSGASSLPN